MIERRRGERERDRERERERERDGECKNGSAPRTPRKQTRP